VLIGSKPASGVPITTRTPPFRQQQPCACSDVTHMASVRFNCACSAAAAARFGATLRRYISWPWQRACRLGDAYRDRPSKISPVSGMVPELSGRRSPMLLDEIAALLTDRRHGRAAPDQSWFPTCRQRSLEVLRVNPRLPGVGSAASTTDEHSKTCWRAAQDCSAPVPDAAQLQVSWHPGLAATGCTPRRAVTKVQKLGCQWCHDANRGRRSFCFHPGRHHGGDYAWQHLQLQ
jgi:hypothetical protein